MDCKHETWRQRGSMGHLMLEDGHHTETGLLQCVDCGKIEGFPDENLELAINEGTPETLRRIIRHFTIRPAPAVPPKPG